ncbi:DNA topology modulation protein [Christensenella sp. MSJ-20]|uniref:DNA topology modulation protein n=1 Tax=Christensenella sp. MSJ-20 TaxID=2841518 RepID=UPI000D7B53E2|nr:MAG: DNA topology modulation protein FlaR [Bacillota bacterium]PWL41543.1 MAG: DNA topology modulation protein FlaR [Bacillota bacterium]QWT55617.1 DNA topology modulation protein [Christensenella sp. MSJ-20]
MRIAIIGYSGSGKSTLAAFLGNRFGIPVLYLDTVQFEANWKERNREEGVAMAARFMEQPEWVIDGNYRQFLQEERLAQADWIIFLRFSRWSCFRRAWSRYCRYRNTTRESMAPGCQEKFDLAFAWWILYRGRDRAARAHYDEILERYGEKTVVLKNQGELDAFMRAPFDRGDPL